MEPQLLQEWIDLRSRTWEHLRTRGHILQPKHKPLLQLLAMPSFHDSWCLDLLETDGTLSAYRTTWHSSQDSLGFQDWLVRLRHPRPFVATLSSVRLEKSESAIRQILDAFEPIDIPTDWEDRGIFLDGTSFEFQIGNHPTLEWENGLPEDWPKSLCDAIESLCRWAEFA